MSRRYNTDIFLAGFFGFVVVERNDVRCSNAKMIDDAEILDGGNGQVENILRRKEIDTLRLL